MHLVMFDIDGTLVDSAGFDTELYVEAVRTVLNVDVDSDWNIYEHVSDSSILEEVMRCARSREPSGSSSGCLRYRTFAWA